MWVPWMTVVVLLAVLTAVVAESKGQSAPLWFVVGLIAPLFALVVAVVVLRPPVTVPDRLPAPAEAARHSEVARLLDAMPDLMPHEVATRTGIAEREVTSQLVALRNLGLADRDRSGRWRLTLEGAAAIEG